MLAQLASLARRNRVFAIEQTGVPAVALVQSYAIAFGLLALLPGLGASVPRRGAAAATARWPAVLHLAMPDRIAGRHAKDMPMTRDEEFMRRAIALARTGGSTEGASPIGCVIVQDGEIIGEAHNEVDILHDPTAHAEMVAMRRAGKRLGTSEFRGATLYSTLQPCGMCSMASIWGKIGRIVYGAGRDDVHHMYFEGHQLDTIDFVVDAFRDDISLEGGILKRECTALLHKPGEAVPEEEQGNL